MIFHKCIFCGKTFPSVPKILILRPWPFTLWPWGCQPWGISVSSQIHLVFLQYFNLPRLWVSNMILNMIWYKYTLQVNRSTMYGTGYTATMLPLCSKIDWLIEFGLTATQQLWLYWLPQRGRIHSKSTFKFYMGL